MRFLIHAGWLIALAACGGGGGGPSGTTQRAGATSEPPQVAAERAKRDAVCACKDEPCVKRVMDGPLGREAEGPPIQDPATLRLLLKLGQESLECMYRLSGVPEVCVAMIRSANALATCPSLTEEQHESVAEQMRTTTDAWAEIAWRTLSAEQLREYEQICESMAAVLRDLGTDCAPKAQPSGAK